MKKINRITALMLAVFVAFSMIIASTASSYAAGGWHFYLDGEGTVFVGQFIGYGLWKDGSNQEPTVKSIKSSDPKVIKIKKSKYEGKTYYDLIAKKPGTANLTFKYRLPNGKDKTYKRTLIVNPYPNMIESLKVNGKKVKISGDQRYYYFSKYKKTSATIDLKLREGWTVDNVYANYYRKEKTKTIKGAENLLSGGKISFPKKWDGMNFAVEMKNGTETIRYNINIWRR